MNSIELNKKIELQGKEIFNLIKNDKPSLFNKNALIGKLMDLCMRNENFKVQTFRFVDVFPTLINNQLFTSHINEYFGDSNDMPKLLSWGAKTTEMLGSFGGSMLNKLISKNIHEMAKQFIIGENTEAAIANIEKLRKNNFASVVDVLGEATLSDEEAESYVNTYIELIDNLKVANQNWSSLGNKPGNLDWGSAPRINIAVKPSALYCLANPLNYEHSVKAIVDQMRKIFNKVIEVGGFLCIDMESYRFKDITLEVFRKLKLEYPDYPYLGIVLQAYLRDTEEDLNNLLLWADKHKIQISIRLVKGAYWDYEMVKAEQNGLIAPVWNTKAESDASFEKLAEIILGNHSICHLACASHNIRSISAIMMIAHELNVPDDRYEFQVLYGMAEPIRNSILKVTGRVRLYAPYGVMVPGMGYLVRRLLENTANDSFLRNTFADGAELDKLLEDPSNNIIKDQQHVNTIDMETIANKGLPPFMNEPMADFTKKEVREAFTTAITSIRNNLCKDYPLFINGNDLFTNDKLASVNPANPQEILGFVCQAGTKEVELAIASAKKAFSKWRNTSAAERAEYLIKAAAVARKRIYEFSAWEILEAGKQWDQAYADVNEAIDFLEYYAREMIRRAAPTQTAKVSGEINHYFYEPKGVAAIIAPWNFPLAISMGMVSAAIVTGNPVVYKPSGVSSITGHLLVSIFSDVDLPAGVFNYIPGRGSIMGDFLVDHPDISLIAFTGSMEIGLRIIERSSKVWPGQTNVKKVICEMGGKNAIISDDDADLDEAVPHVLYSAFGYQGQKCSACSRVIVLDSVYDKFVERLVKAAKAYKIGPAEDPSFTMGAVIDDKAQKHIMQYIEIGKQEGKLLYESQIPDNVGYYVPLTIIEGIKPEHKIAQEEIFGPVLAIMRANDFKQAIEWANSTRYALTGGVFSRSPRHIEMARREFRVGNLYINRNNTGAMVERQPFGGSRMSGTGTKAGGPDYLLHFMDPRVVTENTMRRGFIPSTEKNSDAIKALKPIYSK